ncbi:ABC transporter substrate-binding protein [Actinomadura chokoriensis]|uniref:ABC transporter substrate-binding protein n=1 Tax=Actinomadura chokoriensis TaxID=454156 RepID=UPI0031FA1F6A
MAVVRGGHKQEENGMKLRPTKRATVAVAAATTIALGLTGCGEGASGDGSESIKVGLVAALSGPAAAFGGPQNASMAAAVERINGSGGVKVDGKTYKFEFKSYDHAYDPTKAVTAANQAITKDGVSFLQVDGGSIVPAVQPVAEKRDVMVMALAGGDQYLGKDHPTTFRLYYDISRSFGASLSYLKSKDSKVQKVLGIFTDDEVGRIIAEQSDGIAKSLGATPSSVFISRDATDFAPVLNQVLPKSPDVIQFGGTPPSQYAGIVKTARQRGYKGDFIFPDTVYRPAVVEAAGKEGVEGSVSSPFFGAFTSEEGKYWTDNISKHKGGDPSQGWSALAYDNLFLLKAAIEKAGTLDTKKVSQAMQEVSFDGAVGEVRYGGKDKYGLNQVIEMDFPVAEIQKDGTLKQVTVVPAAEANRW